MALNELKIAYSKQAIKREYFWDIWHPLRSSTAVFASIYYRNGIFNDIYVVANGDF